MTNRSVRVAVALATLVPSLGTAQSQWTIRQQDPVEVAGRWMGKAVLLDTLAIWTPINASRTRTFEAAVRILRHFNMPIEMADSARLLIVNKRFVPRGKVAGKQRSAWIRCGTGMTGDYADTWRVTMSYAVYVDSTAADKTGLGVALVATATNTEGASKPPILCASNGALEKEIARMVGHSSS
jgi:hypothetical protein